MANYILYNCAAAARSCAGGATETMITGHDLATFDFCRIDFPQKHQWAAIPLHSELLIKVAIVNYSAPAHADRIPTHQTINGCGIKRLNQQLHVFIEFVVASQITRKPADGKIGKRVEPIEHDAEKLLELSLVIGLKLGLRRRQKRAHRIVNEMQRQVRVGSVAYRVKQLQ